MKIGTWATPIGLSLMAMLLPSGWAQPPLPAEPATVAAQAEALKGLPHEDQRDFEAARRGFIASLRTRPPSATPTAAWPGRSRVSSSCSRSACPTR